MDVATIARAFILPPPSPPPSLRVSVTPWSNFTRIDRRPNILLRPPRLRVSAVAFALARRRTPPAQLARRRPAGRFGGHGIVRRRPRGGQDVLRRVRRHDRAAGRARAHRAGRERGRAVRAERRVGRAGGRPVRRAEVARRRPATARVRRPGGRPGHAAARRVHAGAVDVGRSATYWRRKRWRRRSGGAEARVRGKHRHGPSAGARRRHEPGQPRDRRPLAGATPDVVARLSLLIAAMQAEGVAACGKHFPATATRRRTATCTCPGSRTRSTACAPSSPAVRGGGAGGRGGDHDPHVVFEPLDATYPATSEPPVLDGLRVEQMDLMASCPTRWR